MPFYGLNGSTGAFIDGFASVAERRDLFGPDGNLYVLASGGVTRFNGTTGAFIDVFIAAGTGGLGIGQRLLFVDSGCSRYDDNGLTNRCFPMAKGGGKGK